MSAVEPPRLTHALHLQIAVAAPLEIGTLPSGLRRVVPIVGGAVSGLFSGRVLPGGADFQLIRTDTETEVEARYVLESDQGELVTVDNLMKAGDLRPVHIGRSCRLARAELERYVTSLETPPPPPPAEHSRRRRDRTTTDQGGLFELVPNSSDAR